MSTNNIIYSAPNPNPVAFDVLKNGKIFTPDGVFETPKHTYMKIMDVTSNGVIVNAINLESGAFTIFSDSEEVYSLKGDLKVEYE